MKKRIYKGIKKAAGETKDLQGYYSGHYIQVNYDIENDEVLTTYHYSLGQNSFTRYHDKGIIFVGFFSEPTTMSEIKQMIDEKVEFRSRYLGGKL